MGKRDSSTPPSATRRSHTFPSLFARCRATRRKAQGSCPLGFVGRLETESCSCRAACGRRKVLPGLRRYSSLSLPRLQLLGKTLKPDPQPYAGRYLRRPSTSYIVQVHQKHLATAEAAAGRRGQPGITQLLLHSESTSCPSCYHVDTRHIITERSSGSRLITPSIIDQSRIQSSAPPS